MAIYFLFFPLLSGWKLIEILPDLCECSHNLSSALGRSAIGGKKRFTRRGKSSLAAKKGSSIEIFHTRQNKFTRQKKKFTQGKNAQKVPAWVATILQLYLELLKTWQNLASASVLSLSQHSEGAIFNSSISDWQINQKKLDLGGISNLSCTVYDPINPISLKSVHILQLGFTIMVQVATSRANIASSPRIKLTLKIYHIKSNW